MDLAHPHDGFVRSWLSQPDQLAHFLELCLPSQAIEALDLTTLAIESGTFIDEEHREHFSDLQATVDTKNGRANIYLLVEHKSYNDPWALLQILRYMVQIWTRDARVRGSEPLRLIIPILFYHGESANIREEFGSLFGDSVPKELAGYLPHFLCSVFNLRTLPDSSISGPPEQEAALWALKYARTQLDRVFTALSRLCATVDDAFFDSPTMQSLQIYLLANSETTLEQALDRMSALVANSRLRGDTMNTAQQLVARGKQEGKVEGKLEAAERLKDLGVSIDIICEATGLARDLVERLHRTEPRKP